MTRLLRKALLSLSLLAASHAAWANTASLIWKDNPVGGTISILDASGNPLSGAGSTADGDGFVLQLGYYSAATISNPFLGTWVPVYGPGTSNTLFGQAGMGDGTGLSGTADNFSFSGTVDTANPGTSTNIPAAGQIMAIRYYDTTSLATADYYGAASDQNWLWVSPVPQPSNASMSFNMQASGVVYQGGATAPQTNIAVSPVPEPSTLWSLASGLAVGAVFLKRRR